MRYLLFSLLALASASQAAVFEPHANRYEVLMGDKVMGEGVIQLEPWAGEGCWHYHYNAVPRAWIRWLTGKINEESWFCDFDGVAQTQRYRFRRDGLKAARKNYEASFDWMDSEVTVTGGKENSTQVREMKEGTTDKLLLQLVASRDAKRDFASGKLQPGTVMKYHIVAVDRNKDYEFTFIGEEQIKVGDQSYPALRIDRIKSPTDRISFWLDRDNDMRVLRVETHKEDRVFTMRYVGPVLAE